MNSIPNSAGFTLPGGKIGILVIHGFTGSPVTVKPWAEFLNQQGYTVSTPCLPGHGSTWQQMNESTWQDWYKAVEESFLELQGKCNRIFIAIVIGGGVVEAGELFLNPVRLAMEKYMPFAGTHSLPKIVAAKYGNDAGLIGAADLVRG